MSTTFPVKNSPLSPPDSAQRVLETSANFAVQSAPDVSHETESNPNSTANFPQNINANSTQENAINSESESGNNSIQNADLSANGSEIANVDGALYRVIRRDGREVSFRDEKIVGALTKAFLAAQEKHEAPTARHREQVATLTKNVIETLQRRRPAGGAFAIEEIQDGVELALMRAGEHEVARRYVLYREERNRAREKAQIEYSNSFANAPTRVVEIVQPDGTRAPLDIEKLRRSLGFACAGLENFTDADALLEATLGGLYDGMPHAEVQRAAIMAVRPRIESAPEYAFVAARLLLDTLCGEVFQTPISHHEAGEKYRSEFANYIERGIAAGRLAEGVRAFDLTKIADALRPERDLQFAYMGLQTLYDRYLIHIEGARIELPQWFWMRIALGLSQNEIDGEISREERAIGFYNVMSQFHFVPSTPTLFNSGTQFPQLSSCYLTTIGDDLGEIFDAIRDNALLSKFSGGLGNDWTAVRAMGAQIESTNGKSQGIVPFLKVANDTAVAVNQGGKRQGAVCAYIEPWHLDIEEFLDLRKNTGDDRRRTHDMHTALWIPDLFLQRVTQNAKWTLFSPEETPDLHDSVGLKFAERYEEYEKRAAAGEMRNVRVLDAAELWRKTLTRLFETGHPWITFKDAANLRSPQQHAGVVHSSNLCTEITLNTSKDEIAVCNLGSVNLAAHVDENGLKHAQLAQTVATAMRMLDNVIELNLYPVPQAKRSNLRHRPVGLGVMGFQDALHKLRLPYASQAAIEFADQSQEAVSYHAILSSSHLAKERGSYESFRGSLWDKGVLPIDSLQLLADARPNRVLDVDTSSSLDWAPVRAHIARHGMRNSNCLAIAPTATIANIIGVSASIEPNFSNLFVKSNLSGEFTVVNPHLVADLRARDLWNRDSIDDLKYFDGVLTDIERIPADLRELYATAFEIEPAWIIEAASRRQKWIDMGQSLNIYLQGPTGKQISDTYFLAWRKGLKTTYYLRTKAATNVEKSTLDINRKAIQPRWMKAQSASSRLENSDENAREIASANVRESAPLSCSIDGDCEACQ